MSGFVSKYLTPSKDTPMARRNPIRALPPGSFEETFNKGALDTSKWVISTGTAPGGNANHAGTFATNNVDLSTGMLRLKLDQAGGPTNYTSSGAELSTIASFGYGTYRFIYRASSTAATPQATGSTISGSITGLFNYRDTLPTSYCEIDFEVEGQTYQDRHKQVAFTNWTDNDYDPPTNPTQGYSTGHTPWANFIDCRWVWTAGRIDYYVGEVLRHTATTNVPVPSAPIFINHWGTHNINFGGTATVSTPRYLYVSYVSFIPA